MTTYVVRSMRDGTFLVRHGSRIVAAFGEWAAVAATLDVMDAESIAWEWEHEREDVR